MGTRITEEWLLKNGVTREQIDAGDPNLARRASVAPIAQPRSIPGGPRRGIFIELAGIRPPTVNEVTKVGRIDGIRIKKAFFAAVSTACLGLLPASGKRRVSMLIELPKRRHRPDRDNLWKYPLDGLKNAGQLVNDSPDWVEQGDIRFITEADRLATTIFLEDV